MSNLVFVKHSDKKIIPLRALVFYDGDWTTLTLLGKESMFNFTPITRSHYKGGEITLGYNFGASAIIDFNDFENNGLIARLEKLRKRWLYAVNTGTDDRGRTDTQLILGDENVPGAYGAYAAPEMPFATGSMFMELSNNVTVSWEIEYVEFRPRVVLTLKGFFKEITAGISNSIF